MQGYGTPGAVYGIYAAKIVLYVGVWIAWCGTTPGLGALGTIGEWWLHPIAFEKAILWSMLFEGLGLGCGSGPLTGRYFPPIGGALYFARPRTTKLAVFPTLPLLGGTTRSVIDVGLYLGLVGLLVVALASPVPQHGVLVAIAIAVPVVGLADRTIFLAMRSEHYWTTIVCFAFAPDWIAGAKAVQLALWWWAGFSKLNHHFPAVVCVMTSNSPFTRFAWLRRRMYRDYPSDLRPSRLAMYMGHMGTALELGTPLVLAFAPSGTPLVVGVILALVLHGYITSNVPMGVPIEWNFMVVYGVFALFWAHPDVTPFATGSIIVDGFLIGVLVGLPLFGNLYPHRLSFLLAMRYYAGNWAYGVWLFRGDSYRKLGKLTTSAPWIYDQLARFYDRSTSVGIVGTVMAFRLMHLHGRALPHLIPKAVPSLPDHEYLDGELVAGYVLGWNFGDGHLHREPLLAAVQDQCGFEPGELRCVFVESQPLGKSTLAYRIVDAATGLVDSGELTIAQLRGSQPWSHEPHAARVG